MLSFYKWRKKVSDNTKVAIADAFKSLIQDRGISKINVQDISSLAGVSRHTFYYHFRDVYSLTEWIFESEGKRLFESYDKLNNWEVGLERACSYAVENRVLVIRMYHSIFRENLINFFQKIIYSIISRIVDSEFSNIEAKDDEKNFLLDFYTFGCAGTLCKWLDNNMEEDYHMIVDKLHTIIHGSIEDALIRFSGGKV